MNKALLAGLATTALVTAGFAGAAEARCFRTGHHVTCTHQRMHYSHRPHYRTWAAGYGHRYAYPYYGSSYPAYYGSYPSRSYGWSYSGSSFGPRPNGDSGY